MSGYSAQLMSDEESVKFYEEYQREQLIESFEEYIVNRANKNNVQD
ncbi:MAG: hypothetical protein ACQESF_02650 [Nanobdellota archaeon]